MGRPRSYFACYRDGRVFTIVHGHDAARQACGGRRTYKAFSTALAAEEFSAWLEYSNSTMRRREREFQDSAYAIARANTTGRTAS